MKNDFFKVLSELVFPNTKMLHGFIFEYSTIQHNEKIKYCIITTLNVNNILIIFPTRRVNKQVKGDKLSLFRNRKYAKMILT